MAKEYVAPSRDNTNLTDDEVIRMLKGVADDFDKQDNPAMAKGLYKYLRNRPYYLKNHKGKYAQITTEKVNITDKTSLDKEDLCFHSKLKGLLLKVGNEIEKEPEIVRLM